MDDPRLPKELAGELPALEEGIVARHVREDRSKIRAGGVAAHEEALGEVDVQRRRILGDLRRLGE